MFLANANFINVFILFADTIELEIQFQLSGENKILTLPRNVRIRPHQMFQN